MLSWVVLNFILVIYSNATQLTYSLIGLLVITRRVVWISSVRPSVQKFSWNWLFSFFRELNMVLGTHVVLCMTEPDFLKKMFYSQNGEHRPRPGFFECIGKFSFFSYFFNGPKCSWLTRLQDFSINRRTLKLAVSHKRINKINWFLVRPSNSFLMNGSLGFSDFWHNGM